MKILHINTHSHGGAFKGAYRLHKALLKNGLESKMLVSNLDSDHSLDNVFQYNTLSKKATFLNRLSTRFKMPVTAEQKKWNFTKGMKGDYEIISFPFSDYDITNSKEYKEADIIHLHWVADFLDYKSFFKKNKKPIVWTLRDSFPFLGIFHLKNDLIRNDALWKQLDARMLAMKNTYLKEFTGSFYVVGISNNITKESRYSSLLGNYPHEVIHNCIDKEQFKIINKDRARHALNIDAEKKVFCFVADYVDSYNKGYAELKQAFSMIHNRDIEVISVGAGGADAWSLSIRHRHFGRLNSEELQLVYSASDAFVFPTKEEALGNVMLEAMACGTPVIGTPVGGLLDVIKEGFNGVFAEDCSAAAINKAVLRFIEVKESFNRSEIREYIVKGFSEEKVAKAYLNVYNNILDRNFTPE